MTIDNILVLVTDDQAAGSVPIAMPNFTSMLGDGRWQVLPNLDQSTPVCGASRATLLGGQRCDFNGVTGNTTSGFNHSTWVPKAIQNAGGKFGIFGKELNAYDSLNTFSLDACWIMHTGDGESTYYTGWEATATGGILETPADYPGEYITDIIFAKALEFMLANDGWVCYLAPTAPHALWTPPSRYSATTFPLNVDPDDWNILPTNAPSWLASLPAMSAGEQTSTRSDRLNALRTLRAVDDGWATTISALSAAGLLDRTLIITCTDNAVAMGRKRMGTGNPEMQKRSPYCYSTSGIGYARHPQATGGTNAALLDFLDIPATMIDVFGATPLNTLHGRSLIPDLLGTQAAPRQATYSTHRSTEQPEVPVWSRAHRVIDGVRWWFADYYVLGETDLYDITTSRVDSANVAAANPDIVAQFQTFTSAAFSNPLWWDDANPRSVTRTLDGTLPDLVTLEQLWPAAEITNHSTTVTMYLRTDGLTAAFAADNTKVLLPRSTKVVRLSGQQISVVGNGNTYTVEGVQ